ncbi:MAG: PA domain-containing protein, partial [Pseudonocardiaceae bacterium]
MRKTKASSARIRVLGPILVVSALAGSVLLAPAAIGVDSAALRNAVTVAGIREHQQALQNIADANGGTRLAGTAGYDESADYVYDRLVAAGYSPVRQQFDFAFFQETATPELDRVSPDPKSYVEGTDILTMQYSGSGDPTAPLVTTNDIVIPPTPAPSSTSGCETSDFPANTLGSIVLIQRGTCTFGEKATNAEDLGAVGVIIFNEGNPGRTDVLDGTLGGPDFTIPVTGTSFAVGEELFNLLGAGPVTMHM